MPNPGPSEETKWMDLALRLAWRGQGRVEPNPMVGCVLVRGGRLVGAGFHRRFGGPHAEVFALRQAGRRAQGATAYVTLEPCCHHGKTPPCTDALIAAGVRRVFAATGDDGEHVRGKGVRQLRQAGMEVHVGLLETEARDLIKPYLTLLHKKRPHVVLKWAQGLDGRISTPPGQSNQISGEQAHRWLHQLRARVDGILVGIGTVLADDPRLTARGVSLRRVATRIVLDSRLRMPLTSQLVRTARQTPTLLLATRAACGRVTTHVSALESHGVRVLAMPASQGRVSLPAAMRALGREKITNLLVEGGRQVLSKFFRAELVDEAYVLVAPVLIGGLAPPLELRIGSRRRPVTVQTRRVGPDTLFHARFAF